MDGSYERKQRGENTWGRFLGCCTYIESQTFRGTYLFLVVLSDGSQLSSIRCFPVVKVDIHIVIRVDINDVFVDLDVDLDLVVSFNLPGVIDPLL